MRLLAIAHPAQAQEELLRIGVDPKALPILLSKLTCLAIKLNHLPASTANILKQTALALGADCAIHRDVVRARKRYSDALLIANRRQLQHLAARLQAQPPTARALGSRLAQLLENYPKTTLPLRISGQTFDLASRTYLAGIINVTPDSFSDGGQTFEPDMAVARGIQLVEQGADFLDVGGESTRPGAQPVDAQTELARVLPVLRRLRRAVKVPISIDTTKSEVARRCLDQGADIINDISGLRFDPKMARTIARAKAACIIMHIKGRPRTMQRRPSYRNLMTEIVDYFTRQVAYAQENGIPRDQIVIDPGIGFGKTLEHNLCLIRRLSEFRSLGLPIMLGPSRKSFIGMTLGLPVAQRLEGTIAASVLAIAHGANILRVHDIEQVRRAALMTDAILGAGRWTAEACPCPSLP